MKHIVCSLAIASVVALGGCSSTQQISPEPLRSPTLAAQAHESLVGGNLAASRQQLNLTRQSAMAEGVAVDDLDLLEAEIHLQQGEKEQATAIATRVMERDATNPQAHEILGKVAIRNGDLDAALQYIEGARQHYAAADDRQRAEDLIALVRGLAAYGQASPDQAKEYWTGIRGQALRESIQSLLDQLDGDQVARRH